MSLEQVSSVFGTSVKCLQNVFWSSLLQVALNLARNEAWAVSETLCSLRWCVCVYSIFKELLYY